MARFISGLQRARAHARLRINVTRTPISLARSARRTTRARRWWCPTPTPRPCKSTLRRSAHPSPPRPTASSSCLSVIARNHLPVIDGAGWHKSGALGIPENLSILFLPPYSPELNPVENIWQYLRQTYLSNRVFKNWEAIVDACCDAWNRLIAETGRIKSIATRSWAATGQ